MLSRLVFSTLAATALFTCPVIAAKTCTCKEDNKSSSPEAELPSTSGKTKILVPLYSWSQDCWPELQKAAKENPTVSWILILNPNSGPLVDPKEPALYCVPKLRQILGQDTVLTGYVRTGYNDRSLDEIEKDVETYEKWKDIQVEGGSTAKLDGIFFDETSDTSKDRLSAFKKYAQKSFGSSAKIISNPGTYSGNEYFDSASYVVDYESAFDQFDASNLPTSKEQLEKSIVMIHDLPSSTSLSSVLTPLVESKKVGGVFVTDLKIAETDIYQSFGESWDDFVAEVATLNA